MSSAGIYLDILVKQWTATIHTKLPEKKSKYDKEVTKLIGRFIDTIADSAGISCPNIAESVERWRDSSLRTITLIRKTSAVIFEDTIQDAARYRRPDLPSCHIA